MKYEAIPRLRLEVESLKHSIIAHMGVSESELGEALSTEIDKALASYDWQGQVSRIVHAELTKRIEDYFKFGDGHSAIKDAVGEGFAAAMGKTGER
jgi:hypothetical protein